MQRTEGWCGGGGKWVMGIEEGTCWDEHWVLYVNDESRNVPPKQRAHYIHCMLANLTIISKTKESTMNVSSQTVARCFKNTHEGGCLHSCQYGLSFVCPIPMIIVLTDPALFQTVATQRHVHFPPACILVTSLLRAEETNVTHFGGYSLERFICTKLKLRMWIRVNCTVGVLAPTVLVSLVFVKWHVFFWGPYPGL